MKKNKNNIEKKVKTELEKKLKREAQQTKQLQEYLKKVDKIRPLSDKEIIKLWDELVKKIEGGKEEEKLKIEREIFRAHLKEIVSIAKKRKDEPNIKPYFTFLEVIKEGEKGLWKAIRQGNQWQIYTYYKTSIASNAINRQINESVYRKRWKIVTGEDYQDRLDLVSIAYVGHPVLDNSSLRFAERALTDKKFRKTLKQIKN